MKKILSLGIGLFVSTLFGLSSHVLAQSNTSLDTWLQSILGGFGNFGYIGTNVSVKSSSSTGVVIESPVIRDESQQDVLKYVVWYGPYPFGKLLDGSSGVSTADFKSKEFTFSGHSGQTFTMALTPSDGLVATQLYYATVVPIAVNGDSGEMSGPDICFRMSTNQSAVGVQCAGLASGTHNSAGGANMQLANISNTCVNNQITLTWSAIPGAERVRIERVVNGQQSTLITTVNMSAQTHSYPLPNPVAPEVVRFTPLDASGNVSGTQHDYTLKLCTPAPSGPVTPSVPGTPRPGVTTVPKVGPEQDIAYVILATLFVYGIVRLRKYRKAK